LEDIDKRISIIVKACDDKKAFNIKTLNISKLTSIADYFIIASGNSTTQVAAISDEIEEKMSDNGFNVFHKEGYKSSRWILLDFGDIVVHVFHREDREFYNLERLWSDGEEIDNGRFLNAIKL
jgi:ribosome-associated protein